MVDFAAHFTIHTIKIGFQKYYILPGKCACQSDRSLRYFPSRYRITYSFAIHHSSSHMLLAAEKRFGVVRKQLLGEKLIN